MEKFSFDISKMKFESTNPGKETKSNLVISLIFVLALVVAVIIGCYVLHINLAALFGVPVVAGIRGAIKKWGKGNSP